MEEPFLAEIRLIHAGTLPEGWALCDGRKLLIEQFPDLFTLLGNTYGGDGKNTFALPDLVGRKQVPLESHLVKVNNGQQAALPSGRAGVNLPDNIRSSGQPTYFCIALQGVFPVSTAD